MIEWLMERLEIEESGNRIITVQNWFTDAVSFVTEALNIANQLCQYGYFFPISDSKNLAVKDDSSLYRFQVDLHIRNVWYQCLTLSFYLVSLLLALAKSSTW